MPPGDAALEPGDFVVRLAAEGNTRDDVVIMPRTHPLYATLHIVLMHWAGQRGYHPDLLKAGRGGRHHRAGVRGILHA